MTRPDRGSDADRLALVAWHVECRQMGHLHFDAIRIFIGRSATEQDFGAEHCAETLPQMICAV